MAVRGRQGGFYDRFRGRIMFPLADERGRVRGFGARAMRDAGATDSALAISRPPCRSAGR